jgi:hypothetical protein
MQFNTVDPDLYYFILCLLTDNGSLIELSYNDPIEKDKLKKIIDDMFHYVSVICEKLPHPSSYNELCKINIDLKELEEWSHHPAKHMIFSNGVFMFTSRILSYLKDYQFIDNNSVIFSSNVTAALIYIVAILKKMKSILD